MATICLLALLGSLVSGCVQRTPRYPVDSTPASLPASRVVVDDLNRRVEIKDTPQRIVALSPTAVEILFALGVTPVGRPANAVHPEAAKQVADIGTPHRPNYERIADLQPDFIIGNVITSGAQLSHLENLGVPVALFSAARYDDVLKYIKLTGEITGREAEAQRTTKEIEGKLAVIKAKTPTRKPTVLILIGSGRYFYGALPSSYVGSLVKELEAVNLASGAEDSRYRGFTPLTFERLAEKNPDVIIAIRPTANHRSPSVLPMLETDTRWLSLKASKAKAVHEVSPALFMQSPGTRMGDALAELAALLYPQTR